MFRGRSIWSMLAYVAGFFIFVRLRGYADNAGIPTHFRYPVAADHWLFNGHDPVVWLQNRVGQTTHANALDYFVVIVYISYFVVPPATVLFLWWFRSRGFPIVALTILATLYTGLLINFLVPTAPPWMAANRGLIAHFPRLVPIVLNGIVPGIYGTGDTVGGANNVAAMPSLHIGITAAVSYYYMSRGRIGMVLGILYILAMAFTLVYLGEHYFIDIVAGVSLAAVCSLGVRWGLIFWYRRQVTEETVAVEVEEEVASPGD